MSEHDSWAPADATDSPASERDVVASGSDPDGGTKGGSSRLRRVGVPVGLLGVGALVGGVLAATLTANASSPTPSPPPAYGYGAPGAHGGGFPGGPGGPGRHGGFHGLDHTGTVTAVGANSVTIKESSGTTTYAVGADSDIDKNGEAKLSDLKAGDAVRFNVVTVSGKKTIGILHSGTEALNRPQHAPGDHPGDHPGMPGAAPSGTDNENSSSGFTNA